jgi:phytoene dehydrogenase-like protein
MPDAVVIGAGPNGLVAANALADAGYEVLVVEASESLGGAVRTEALTGDPAFRHDVFSAFYPFAVASPAIERLELERHGLRWRRAPLAVAHPAPDGSCPAISMDLEETAAMLESLHAGDGERWQRLHSRWRRVSPQLMQMLSTPMPPFRPSLVLAAKLRRDLPRFARFMLLPARRMAEESLGGAAARRLLAGHASHTDLQPEAPPSGAFAFVLAGLAQECGFPAPEGGAQRLAEAMASRLRAKGGEIECGTPVERVLVEGGRATGVRLGDGRMIAAGRAVIADVDAPTLYEELLPRERLPRRLLADLERFEWDAATVKCDWALDGPIPWAAEAARRSGVVHVGELDELTVAMAQLATRRLPAKPALVIGQYSPLDPTRSPPGSETAWAYTQVPREVAGDAGGEGIGDSWDDEDGERFATRIEGRIEELAPGFRDLIRARHVLTPAGFESRDLNLVGGSMQGGTSQLHQQGPFRPTPGLGRPETPIAGLYLGSASAHPGGGVHGGPGHNAARAALAADLRRPLRRPLRGARGGA